MALGRTNNRGTSRGGSTYGGSGPATAIQWSSVAHICASYGALVASGRTNNRGTSWGDSSFGGSGPTTAVQWSTSITFTPTRPHVGVAAPRAALFHHSTPEVHCGSLFGPVRRSRASGVSGRRYPSGAADPFIPRGRASGPSRGAESPGHRPRGRVPFSF